MRTYLLAVLLLPMLMIVWIAVQAAWRRQFSASDADGDVLADRRDCGQCGCATPCDRSDNDKISIRGKAL